MMVAEEVAVCDADEEAAAELAACNGKAKKSSPEEAAEEAEEAAEEAAARWAFWAPEPLAKEASSKEAVATTWAVATGSERCGGWALLCLPTTLSQNGYWYKLESC